MIHISQVVPPMVASITYIALSFVAEMGVSEAISLFDKLGGAGLAALVAYLVIRWLLRERETQSKKLEEMHKERLEVQERHHEQILELLKKK